MDYEDYLLTVRGKRMFFELQEGLFRRSTFIIANTTNVSLGGSGIEKYMDNWWPFGSEKTIIDITEALKLKREIAKKEAIKLTNDVRLAEVLKKIRKRGGSRLKNSNRGGGKSGSKGSQPA